MSNIWILNQTADDILSQAIVNKDFNIVSSLVDVYDVPLGQYHVNLAKQGSEMKEYLQSYLLRVMSNNWILNQTANDILSQAIMTEDFNMMSALVDVYGVPVGQYHVNLAKQGSEMKEYLQSKLIV
jgi:hypothetical protein